MLDDSVTEGLTQIKQKRKKEVLLQRAVNCAVLSPPPNIGGLHPLSASAQDLVGPGPITPSWLCAWGDHLLGD